MFSSKRWLLILAGIIFLVISTYIVQLYIAARQLGTTPQYFGPSEENQEVILKLILVAVIMMLGIISSYLFEKVKTLDDGPINLWAELKTIFTSSKFFLALIVTPIIFNSIYLVVGDNPQGIGDYLLAFQNGFFWETILEGLPQAQTAEIAK